MTNSIALGIGFVGLALIGADLYGDTGYLLFFARKFVDLIAYIAFWR